ncbi:hypothetical protein K443DRAFT_156136 [Laccaria amethystina LaAM-08-1]|uniref:Uncharacterized protein n=1 Tax=Laccaria amethystina LaAM-08-1 TaxID=1095629 RepID=A0A0C9WKP0_9AGAR|nr:hypothetical protein K443DRAFT_156136 [Laccaria amethystina LaAM-08-1]
MDPYDKKDEVVPQDALRSKRNVVLSFWFYFRTMAVTIISESRRSQISSKFTKSPGCGRITSRTIMLMILAAGFGSHQRGQRWSTLEKTWAFGNHTGSGY